MKILVLILLLIASHSGATDIIKFKNGVTFDHKGHQTDKVGKCFVCHDNLSVSGDGKTVTTTAPGKIGAFGKEWAHTYCADCHELFGEGPVACPGCHKK